MTNSNSSDIVTHLRTIHFFLVLACILVLISLLASPSTELKTAYDQLQTVFRIRAGWKGWTRHFSQEQITWLTKNNFIWPDTVPSHVSIPLEEVKRHLSQSATHWRNKVWTLMPLYSPIYLYMMVAVPDGPLRHQILAYGHLKDGRLEIITEGDSTFIDTLDGFRRFWNHANTIQAFLVTEFSKVIHSVANGRITTDLRWETGLKSEDLNRLSLECRGVGSSNRGKRCYPEIETLFQSHWRLQFNTFFCTWIPNNQGQEGPDALVLLANSRDQELPTNLRAWLADEFRLSTVGGTFEEQFSALHRVTTDYQELELRKVGRIIGAELQRSGDRVEFLGLKFPERVISTWGVVIIASIQLYFYLHLRAFRSRLTPIDPGLNLAWIGLYPDRLAFVVSLVTISLLPMGLISYLAYLVMQSGRPQWVIDFKALGFLAFLLLGFCVACASFNLIWDLNSLSKWRRDLSR